MNFIKKYNHEFILLIGLFILLISIWVPAFIVTGDGACHLYNAKIITELWKDGKDSFFSNYFEFNPLLSPNWIGHLLLSPLVYLFKAAIAEKIFFSFYVCLWLVFPN